ncbi:MAG: hypothetical protein ACREIC_01440, partial [Limisphaerales bacterium]
MQTKIAGRRNAPLLEHHKIYQEQRPLPATCRGLGGCLGWLMLAWLFCAASAPGQGVLVNGGNHDGVITAVNLQDSWTFTANTGDRVLLRVGTLTSTNYF